MSHTIQNVYFDDRVDFFLFTYRLSKHFPNPVNDAKIKVLFDQLTHDDQQKVLHELLSEDGGAA